MTPGHGHRREDQLADPLRIPLGVGQAERDAPGPAPHQPALDAEVLAQPFHVRDQVVGGVARKVGRGVASVGSAASGSTLVELDDQVRLGVEEATPLG
jgi:hypothetical protein